MTRIKKPKRVLLQSNDYNRFKTFRKLKRRSKNKIDLDTNTKQLRKKLKLPK